MAPVNLLVGGVGRQTHCKLVKSIQAHCAEGHAGM